MLARVILQMFLPKRYQQFEVDLCRVALYARPDWSIDKVMWMDSHTKLKEIEPWVLKHAEEALANPDKINVEVSQSAINNAGEGVFCKRGAPVGTLLCVHPGTIHSASSVRLASEQGQGRLFDRIFVNDLQHCVQLFDGTVIDAGKESLGEWTPHPFAVGHKCNHPPKGLVPNVIKCPFWWNPNPKVNVVFPGFPERKKELKESEDDEDDEADYESVNKKDSPRSLMDRFNIVEKIRAEMEFTTSDPGKGIIRGLAFISTRNIEPGEELLVNYRYNPKVPPPDWYHPVDPKEDEARWS